MSDSQQVNVTPADQLVQVRVALDDAADAFATKDASGHVPIVVLTTRQNRIRNDFVVMGLLVLFGGLLAGLLFELALLGSLAIPLAALLVGVGVWRSFYVIVPEGTNALLSRRGKYAKTLTSGYYILPPWIVVSHLVTRREVPYDVPVIEAPTADNIRAAVDTLVTFVIANPYQFVYNIAADDFDLVMQSVCQEALRTLIRRTPSGAISDLLGQDTRELQERIQVGVENYGVQIARITITSTRPPEEFMRAQELRQLAVIGQAEQAAKQILARQRQTDAEALELQHVLAEVERERQALQAHLLKAELAVRLAELAAEVNERRMARQEELLARYPRAAAWEWADTQLNVARDLATNGRIVLQLGEPGDLTRLISLHEIVQAGQGMPQDSPLGSNGQQASLSAEQPAAAEPEPAHSPQGAAPHGRSRSRRTSTAQ
jgi:regulator of protease activity HflC (stomatin/prohibitin superfamily)